MEKQTFTLQIIGKNAIAKLEGLGRKKGEYVSALIDKDIEIDELRKRIEKLEGGKK